MSGRRLEAVELPEAPSQRKSAGHIVLVEHLCTTVLGHLVLVEHFGTSALDITWILPGTLINVAKRIVLCCSIFKFSGTLFGGQGRCGYVVIQLGIGHYYTNNDHQQRRKEYQEL